MNRMMGVALALLAILGAALALWSPAGGSNAAGLKEEVARLTAAREAAERALTSVRGDLDQAKAAVNAAREDGERKLAAAKADADKAIAAVRRETEGMVAALKAEAEKAASGGGERLAALRAEAEKTAAALRDQLTQCRAATDTTSARCAGGTSAPSSGAVAAADIARELATSGSIALYGIQFDSGSAKLTAESRTSIDEVAKLMKDDPKLKLLVVGHTDNKGDFNINRVLSEQRAQAVVTDLVNRAGVEATRLSSAGVADLAPVSTNDTDAGRARNRRVEFVKR